MWTLHKLFRPLYLWGRFSWHLKSGLSSTAWGHSYSARNTCLNHHHSRNMCYTYEHLALSPSNWPEKKVSSCQGSQGSEAVKAVKLLKQWITSIVHIWTCLFRSIQPNAHPYIQYMQYILWRSLSLCYDAGFPTTIRVSSTALGWTHEASLGVYQKTSQIASQRPVWKHLKRDRFLFFNGKPIQLDSYNIHSFIIYRRLGKMGYLHRSNQWNCLHHKWAKRPKSSWHSRWSMDVQGIQMEERWDNESRRWS